MANQTHLNQLRDVNSDLWHLLVNYDVPIEGAEWLRRIRSHLRTEVAALRVSLGK